MLNRISNLKSSIAYTLNESLEVAERYPGIVFTSTVGGVVTGLVFGIVYLSSEPAQRRELALEALKRIQNTYDCTVEYVPSYLRDIEYKCKDGFTAEEARQEAIRVIDDSYGTVGSQVATGFAAIIGGMVGGGVVGFFSSTAALKEKEKIAELKAAREEALRQKEIEEQRVQVAEESASVKKLF